MPCQRRLQYARQSTGSWKNSEENLGLCIHRLLLLLKGCARGTPPEPPKFKAKRLQTRATMIKLLMCCDTLLKQLKQHKKLYFVIGTQLCAVGDSKQNGLMSRTHVPHGTDAPRLICTARKCIRYLPWRGLPRFMKHEQRDEFHSRKLFRPGPTGNLIAQWP